METSLAERLGYAGDARVLVVHVDDLGMCHAANQGGFEALRNGPATCGSIMVPCPWFAEAAEIARREPAFDLGVHLTLNAEWHHYRWRPVAGASAVPSLVDAEGFLPRTSAEVFERATPGDVATELRAQIEAALAAGVDVTHLDSHMGTVFHPRFVPVYHELAAAYRLPVFVVRPDEEALARQGMAGFGALLAPLVDRLEADGFPILDGFCADSLGFAEGEGLAHSRRRLEALGPGVHYLICHAAQDGEELRAVTPDSAHQREFERTFYGGEAGLRELDAMGFERIGMRELRDRLRG